MCIYLERIAKYALLIDCKWLKVTLTEANAQYRFYDFRLENVNV